MSNNPVLITAALPYSNGTLHVGHIAGAYLPADIYVRFLRARGRDVKFICGSDDHGVAIMISAEKEGKTPAQVAEYYHAKQAQDFRDLGISFDIYSSTSRNPFHAEISQQFFKSLYAKGQFEKQTTLQFFDESRKMFLADRFVRGTCGYCGAKDQNGDQCEQCGKVLDTDSLKEARSALSNTPASVRPTVHWFLDLSHSEKDVSQWLQSATLRDHTRNYVQGLLSSGLVKRSMTRDISWGIPVPLDDPDAAGKVLYVWFDAPIGYISNTRELLADDPKALDKWWHNPNTEIFHFIGEDNTIFHAVIWIAMLKSEGTYTLPRGVIVNQYVNLQLAGQNEAAKISKSRGHAIAIRDYLDQGGNVDALRYYLTAIAPENSRSVYKPEDLEQRLASELANTLGNFVHRVLTFTRKYFGETVPAIDSALVAERDKQLRASMQTCFTRSTELLEGFCFKVALETIMEFARECNRYIDEKAPWSARKTDPEGAKVSLVTAIAAIKFFAVVLEPFIPHTTTRIREFLNLAPNLKWSDAMAEIPAGHAISEPSVLFPKRESVET